MADNDINDWQPDRNPFQPYSTQGNTPSMSDQEALAKIPDTINIGQLASLQMKNASSDPAEYAQKLNDDYWSKKYDFGQMSVGQAGSTQAQGAKDQPDNTTSSNFSGVTGKVYPPGSVEDRLNNLQAENRMLTTEVGKLQPKPFMVDKGDHYEINVPPNAADTISGTAGGLVGAGLTLAAGGTGGATLMALPIAGYTQYATKNYLSSPMRVPKIPYAPIPKEYEYMTNP